MRFGKRIVVKQHSGAVFFDMGRYHTDPYAIRASTADTDSATDTTTTNTTTEAIEYSRWGDDNQLPNRMVADIKSCGILTGGIDTKIRFGLGTGPEPFQLLSKNTEGKEDLQPIMDAEIAEWMDENNLFNSCFGWFKDLIGLGQDLCRLKFSRNGEKIGLLWRHDVAEMRLQKKDTTGRIRNVYLSAKWAEGVGSAKGNKDVLTIPLVPNVGPYSFLSSIDTDKRRSREFAMLTRLPDWLKHYYSDPNWKAAEKWVEIAKGVPGMKAAMFENNIRLKYMVTIMEEYWTNRFSDWDDSDDAKCEQYRNQVYDEIDLFLVGSENAYKSIFVDGRLDPRLQNEVYKYILIEPIKDETKQGELLPDSAAANFEILFSIGMSPALIGMNVLGGGQYGGGAGSGSDIREAAMVQVMIQSLERHSLVRKLNLASKINGWAQRHSGLVWRFPGQVLTTLDKGTSTEPITSK